MTVLVFLRWPEPCFKVNKVDFEYLTSQLPKTASVVEAKTEKEFLKWLPEATHVVTWYFRKEWFELAPCLKVLATPSAGRELMPTSGPKGLVIHFGGFHGAIMAESVMAFIMAWSRGFFLKQPEGWPRVWMSEHCKDVVGTKAAILGYGKIGRAIASRLAMVGVSSQGYSRHRPLTPAILKALQPDWLILALPSDTGTDDIVNAAFLKNLPRKCVLINVGRGNAVDEKALFAALKEKRIAGAYLDVRKNEPTEVAPKQLPVKPPKLDNLIVMPHASAFSARYVRLCFRELKLEGLFR